MGKFSDIFNADDYNRGMQEGHADGLAGKDRDFSRMGKTAKFILGGSTTLDSYTRGYKAGYFIGAAERLHAQQQAPAPTPAPTPSASKPLTSHITMTRGIDGQIDLLEQMKDFLQSISEQFEDAIKTQTSFLNNLDSEGIDETILSRLQEFLDEKSNKLRDLISLVDDEESPYVEQIIRHLEDTPR